MTALENLRTEKRKSFQKKSMILLLLIFGTGYLAWGLPARFVKPDVQLTTVP